MDTPARIGTLSTSPAWNVAKVTVNFEKVVNPAGSDTEAWMLLSIGTAPLLNQLVVKFEPAATFRLTTGKGTTTFTVATATLPGVEPTSVACTLMVSTRFVKVVLLNVAVVKTAA